MIQHSTPSKSILIGIIGFLFFMPMNPTLVVNARSDGMEVASPSFHDINILLILDHQFGRSCSAIKLMLERYGWNITTSSVNPVLIPCPGLDPSQVLTVDVLIRDIMDVTEYDCVSVMPGVGHLSLIASDAALNLISTAAEEGLIVSGWCTGVRVLAAADVINGRNVTGSAMYREEYEAAGATFIEEETPIIDGNIVTVGRSRYYRNEMGHALASALGVYESNPPVVSDSDITPEVASPFSRITISVTIIEESDIYWIKAKFYNQSNGARELEPSLTLVLTEMEGSSLFMGNTTELGNGNYTVDIHVKDVLDNEAVYTDVCSVMMTDVTSALNGWDQVLLITGLVAVILIPVITLTLLILRRRFGN
jgi:hypothetical protein